MLKIPTPWHSHEESSLNYNMITDLVYIGNNQCCHVALDILLQKENIYADLSLEEDSIDQPKGVSAFLWLPVVDHTPPSKKQILLGVDFIENIVDLGEKIYIHCKNGHGRAPTVFIAYCILKKGMTFEQAFALVKEKRPVIHLDQNQEDFLRSL